MTTTWSIGEYPIMAQRLETAASAVVDAARISPYENVLDVATGTGNAALLAAERDAQVIGIDSDESLLQIARSRTSGSVPVYWQVGAAEALPVSDGWADVALSAFGVMYSSDHDAAARELARCTHANSRIVLANWTPGSFMPTFGRVVAPYLPPPPAASGPPSTWGDLDALRALLGSAGLAIVDARTMTVTMAFDDATSATDFLIRTAGHVIAERPELVRDRRWAALQSDVEALVQSENRGTTGVRIDCEFLLATAHVG